MIAPGVTDHIARVLIVDDERRNRQLLEVMLAPDGFELLFAASGKEALAMVDERAPDLILLDIVMPEMDGYQVAAALKAAVATKNVPIIMISGLDDRGTRMLGLKAGAEDFLTKPVDRAELCVRVRNLLRLKAYGDYHDKYSQMLEGEIGSRMADLRHERDRAQRYLDTAMVIMLALDLDGRITLANRYACTILGWTADELLGCKWIDTCIPERLRAELTIKHQSLLAGALPVYENPVLTRNGAERLVEWRNTVLRDEAGHPTGTFSSGMDITERTEAVRATRAAEERAHFALQSANVGIWDIDYTTGVLKWSPALEAQYGFEPGAFSGTFEAFIDRVHPEDREELQATIGAAMKSGADFVTEHRSIWPDGKVRWLSGAGRVRLGDHGQALRGTGISQDITERHNFEAQSRQANKMEAIGRLSSGVAHDFNNLLTVIMSYAELMSDDAGIASTHGSEIREIIGAARSAAGLTKQLLAFGRQQVLRSAAIDVNALITGTGSMLDRLIGEQISVRRVLAPSLSPALVDKGQMEQVLMNLMVNARDAMPRGGTLTIETAEVDLPASFVHDQVVVPGRYVMLSITDTGVGMNAETLKHLFEPFYTTKEVGKGTGLGLSTTYGIIKQSNGYIWVYSELGLGTTFKVYLPRADTGVTPKSNLVVTPQVTAATETVLLVEDEPRLRKLSQLILDKAGYRVLEAANGDEAAEMFDHHAGRIDLVVTDVIMPGCGGPELFARLKQRAPGLRVLYMSGYTEVSVARAAGIDSGLPFVQKPFTPDQLLRQVRDALTR